MIDRFDGRALLDDRALFMKKKSRKRYCADSFRIYCVHVCSIQSCFSILSAVR